MKDTTWQPQGILLDVDGTLVNSQQCISPAMIAVLRKIEQRAIPCGVCTGRQLAAIQNYILPNFADDALHIVAGGGEMVTSTGKIIWQQTIPTHLAADITRVVRELHGSVVFGQGETLLATDGMVTHFRAHSWHINVQPIDDTQPPQTALLYVGNLNEAVEKYVTQLRDVSIKKMTSKKGHPYFDITARGVNKATTAARWCDIQHLDLKNVMAVGDDYNDEELLKTVGVAVVMEDAPPSIRTLADTIIGRVDDEALPQYLTELLAL